MQMEGEAEDDEEDEEEEEQRSSRGGLLRGVRGEDEVLCFARRSRKQARVVASGNERNGLMMG